MNNYVYKAISCHLSNDGSDGNPRMAKHLGSGLLCSKIYLLCFWKKIAHYAQNYAHVKELCLKSDCSIRV